jgi:hypothetical protein
MLCEIVVMNENGVVEEWVQTLDTDSFSEADLGDYVWRLLDVAGDRGTITITRRDE